MYGIQYYHSYVCPLLFVFNDTCTNINERDVQRKNVLNNVDLYVKFKGTVTKWPVQKLTHRTTQKHVEHQDATDL